MGAREQAHHSEGLVGLHGESPLVPPVVERPVQAAAARDGPAGTGRPRAPRPERMPTGATRLATRRQRGLIAALAAEVEWGSTAGYEGWLRSVMGLERVAPSVQAGK